MNQEQTDAIIAWRQEKGIDRCIACGYDGEMRMGAIVAAPIIEPGGRVRIGDVDTPVIGLVPVVCPNCAYTMLHDPVTMGLVEQGSMEDYEGG